MTEHQSINEKKLAIASLVSKSPEWAPSSKNKTPVLGNAMPALGVKLKRA